MLSVSLNKTFHSFQTAPRASPLLEQTSSYFSFQSVPHDWYKKGRGMCYSVCRILHTKDPLKKKQLNGNERDVAQWLERLLMVLWIVGSIPHGGPVELCLVLASSWFIKGRGMCYSVYGMVHIKDPLLLIGKIGSRFHLLLSKWSSTIYSPVF